VFAPERGGLTRGFVTAYAAPPLAAALPRAMTRRQSARPRWPGTRRDFQAALPNRPQAAQRDLKLYECLACRWPSAASGARPSGEECLRSTLAPHEACDPPSREMEKMATPRWPTLSRNRRAASQILRVTFPRNVATLVVQIVRESGLLKIALAELRASARYDRQRVYDAIRDRLTHAPTTPTTNLVSSNRARPSPRSTARCGVARRGSARHYRVFEQAVLVLGAKGGSQGRKTTEELL